MRLLALSEEASRRGMSRTAFETQLRAAEKSLGVKLIIQHTNGKGRNSGGHGSRMWIDGDALESLRAVVEAKLETRIARLEALFAQLDGRLAALEARRGNER